MNKNADTCATSIKVRVQTVFTFLLHVFFYKLHQQLSYKTVTHNILLCVLFLFFCYLQDYELQLASYSSGLETLLKIPIKRTMLQSPASVVRHEV